MIRTKKGAWQFIFSRSSDNTEQNYHNHIKILEINQNLRTNREALIQDKLLNLWQKQCSPGWAKQWNDRLARYSTGRSKRWNGHRELEKQPHTPGGLESYDYV